jgi:hypothetical protein
MYMFMYMCTYVCMYVRMYMQYPRSSCSSVIHFMGLQEVKLN